MNILETIFLPQSKETENFIIHIFLKSNVVDLLYFKIRILQDQYQNYALRAQRYKD